MIQVKPPTSQIRVYVWDPDGCLERSLDLQSLMGQCAKSKNVALCEKVADPLEAGFLETLRRDVGSNLLDRIIWVGHLDDAMLRKLREALSSSGLNPYMQIQCDLKAQGICDEDVDPPVRFRKALTLLKMALTRARLLEPLEPLDLPANDSVLIIGAGVAGLHTAASLLELGYGVHLVERQSGIGGKTALLERFYPRICDPRCGLAVVIRQLAQYERFQLHTLSTVTSLEGSPGNFNAKVLKRPRFVSVERCNGCGLCREACPVSISANTDWLQDEPPFPGSIGLNALVPATIKAIHPSKPMAFLSAFTIEREFCPEGCDACRTACPNGAVLLDQLSEEMTIQAGAVLVTTGWDPYPLSRLTEFGYGIHPRVIGNLEMERLMGSDMVGGFKHVAFVQCAGSRDERHLEYCSSVCCSATLKQVRSLKDRVPDISCTIFYQDIRTPGFEEDLYKQVRSLENVRFVRGLPAGVEARDSNGTLFLTAEDTFSGKPIRLETDLLVLAGGMTPSAQAPQVAGALNLPTTRDGFFESHHQCYPEESRRTGIYVGGCAREPMNVAQSIESSHRAAMKAIRFLMEKVRVEPGYPVVDKGKCDQCKRCVEECPFAGFTFDEKKFPEPELTRCRQCGNCMGVCPLGAISLRNRTMRQFAAQIEVLETSFLGAREEPLVLAFLCENDAYLAAEEAHRTGLSVPPNVILMKVPCAGAVNNALIADALSLGVDGVMIGGCKDGHCHYINGNRLVRKRSGDLQDKLKTMMIEPHRVRFDALEIRDAVKFVECVKAFVQDLTAMGPNPFKL